MPYEEYRIRQAADSRLPPHGARLNPEVIKSIWERWATGGSAGKPADLERFLVPEGSLAHTQAILDDVLSCCRTLPPPRPAGRILFGQVPLGQFKLFVLPMEDGGHSIILDNYLEGFLSFSCFAALACAFEKPDAGQIERFTAGVFRELDKFCGFGEWETQETLLREMVERSHHAALLAGYTYLAMSAFVFAHEAGHIALGHTTRTRTLDLPAGTATVPAEVLATSHREELDADTYAARVCTELTRDPERWPTVKLEPLYDGVPLFLFDLLEVLHRRYEFVLGHPLLDPEHPTPPARKAALLAAHPTLLSEASRPLSDGLEEFAAHLLENCTRYPSASRRPRRWADKPFL